ncbi:hypothetical protein K439DRAFT_1627900 [Ramaria rubella]|nr:hypothetical protein K439DRAFT_1627900 [Ramaria rubella]
MTDPVGSRSAFLCTYMSGHPDTLVAYVRHFGKVKVPVVSANMTSINTKEMSLSYVLKGSEVKQQVTVSFDPPLSGYEEVKPRLLGMKINAEEALGMIKRPQITKFELPRDFMITTFMISCLIFVTFSAPRPSPSVYNIGPWLRAAVGGPSTLRYIWIFASVIHGGEAAYVTMLCRRHSTGLIVGAQWVICAFLFGFPVMRRLRRTIQKARIDSIAKIH